MTDWQQRKDDAKRDKQLPLRASTNDFNLIDGLIKSLKQNGTVYRWEKYSRMDLIVDAVKAYQSAMFPETATNILVVELTDNDVSLINELIEKRKATNNRRIKARDVISDSLNFASGKMVL